MSVCLLAITACSTESDVRSDGAATANVAAPAETATAPATTDTSRTILFVGTSLTAGYGLQPEQAYPALIQRRLDSLGLRYRVVNAGVSGQTSAGTLRSIDWVMRRPVDIVVIETGANDGLRALSVDTLRANLQAIVDRVRAAQPAATIYLVQMEAPPNLGPSYTAAFRRVYPDVAAANGLTLIPFLLDRVAGVDTLNLTDGIHPNVRGAEIVAENVFRALRERLN